MSNEKLKFVEGFVHPDFCHIKWYIDYADGAFYEASLDEFEGQMHKAYWLRNLILKIENECWNKFDYGHYTEKSFESTKNRTVNILKERVEIIEQSIRNKTPHLKKLTTPRSTLNEKQLKTLREHLIVEELIPNDTDSVLFVKAFSNVPINELSGQKIFWVGYLPTFIYIFLGFKIETELRGNKSHDGFIIPDSSDNYIQRILSVMDFSKKKSIHNKQKLCQGDFYLKQTWEKNSGNK